jgi:hypothetical protein
MTQLCYGPEDTVTMPASAISIGDSTTDKIGLYGVTAISQRAGAAQATSLVGTASSADVTTDLKAAVIEILNALVAIGIIKGSA